MEVLHEAKDPGPGIFASLLQTFHGRSLTLVADSIALHTAVGQLTFLRLQPASGQRSVRQEPEAKDGDYGSSHPFHDEQPSPAANTVGIVETCEYSGSNQARETSCEDLCTVEKCDSRSNLCEFELAPAHSKETVLARLTFSSVENGEHISRSGIKGGLRNAEKESGCDEATVALNERRTPCVRSITLLPKELSESIASSTYQKQPPKPTSSCSCTSRDELL